MPAPAKFTAYNGEKTLSSFEWWNHWPVAQIDSSGRPALAPDRASHTSLSHIYWASAEATESSVTRLLMDGLTLKPAAELAMLAKSWLRPAAFEAAGLRSEGYQAHERAYVFRRDSTTDGAVITLLGSEASPLVNPALIIRNWGGAARVLVNGAPAGKLEFAHRLEGSDLVVWLELESTQPVRIQIEPRRAWPRTPRMGLPHRFRFGKWQFLRIHFQIPEHQGRQGVASRRHRTISIFSPFPPP